MAEKNDKKSEERAPQAPHAAGRPSAGKTGDEPKPARGSVIKSTPILLGVVMVLEASLLFAGFKFLNVGPVAAKGADLVGDETPAGKGGELGKPAKADSHGAATATKSNSKKIAELKVVEFKAPNKQSGRSYLYDVIIYIAAKGESKEKLEASITERDALIKDRIRTIIAQSDPEKLGGAEPGLETFRRQVKHQLEEILGEGIIDEVLVPRCIQYRTDY